MTASTDPRPFDLVFCDTCIGGSTVAATLAGLAGGLRACFLADYAVNPLGVKQARDVRAALESWSAFAAARAPLLVIACNTASVLFETVPDVRERADAAGLRVVSMVDLLDTALRTRAHDLAGSRVCLMGTRFTVTQGVYRDRLVAAGAREVVPLAATGTERVIARLRHTSAAGRREIAEEIASAIRSCDAVVLACTCFPLVAGQIRDINPDCQLIDPVSGLDGLTWASRPGEENRLTLVVTGTAPDVALLRQQTATLFPGWFVAWASTAVA